MKLLTKTAILAGAVLLTACSSSKHETLYHWGNYPDTVYTYYNEPNDLAKQEQMLQAIIQEAQASGKNVGPGVYGQLGLVALKQGKRAEANAAFQQEKTLYPESATFIQYLQSKTK